MEFGVNSPPLHVGRTGCQWSNKFVPTRGAHAAGKDTPVCRLRACFPTESKTRTAKRTHDIQLKLRHADGLTLSAQRLQGKVDGEEKTGDLETHTHLIEILKGILDKKT